MHKLGTKDAPFRKIISSGRSGVEYAALEVGRLLGLAVGGACPPGRLSDFPLVEMPGASDTDCLRLNIQAADAVLIVDWYAVPAEYKATVALAKQLGKPHLLLAMNDGIACWGLRRLLWDLPAATLLITGPQRDIQLPAAAYLARLLSEALDREQPPLPAYLRPAPVTYTIMADFGMGPWGWRKPVDNMTSAVGGNIAEAVGGWSGEHPISAGLVGRFSVWARWFECFYDTPEFEWGAFHKIGCALAGELKREVGDQARVIYSKAFEDPNHAQDENIEMHADGSHTVLPVSA